MLITPCLQILDDAVDVHAQIEQLTAVEFIAIFRFDERADLFRALIRLWILDLYGFQELLALIIVMLFAQQPLGKELEMRDEAILIQRFIIKLGMVIVLHDRLDPVDDPRHYTAFASGCES